MNKFFKRVTAVMISLMTVFTMFPAVNITASAATYCGLEEIDGKVLIKSSDTPLILVDNGSAGKLDAYKFEFNGETGYCIDPQLPAQKTSGETLEFTQFSGDTGKEVLKLDPNSSNQKEKALIVGLSVFFGGYGDYFSTFSNGGKTAKSIMDGYISGIYSSFFNKMNSKDDKYYFLSHYALSQLYHEFANDGTSWKTWSDFNDINTMVNGLVNFANNIAKSSGDYAAIQRSCQMNNYYICQPKGKDGSFCQHLIVRIPKKARLSLQKSGSNDTIKNLTETTQDKDYLNFEGTQYTLYNKSDNSVVAVAELNRNGNIAKILYSYSNKEWISKSYFELEAGNYYLKETKAPNSGKYFTLDATEYFVTITADDCQNERTLDVLNVTDTEIVKMQLKKVSSESELTTDNDCYDLDGTKIAIYASKGSAILNDGKTGLLRYFITDSNGNAKAISKDGNSWDYNLNSDLYKITYSDTLYAVETEAGKGFKKYNKPVKLELSTTGTSGGYALLTATIVNEPLNDPIRILLQKKNAVTGTTENMAGAEFTVKFYKGYYDTVDDLATLTPERKWVLMTNEAGKTALEDVFRSPNNDYGEPFYVDENGDNTLPLGTITIQETKAPPGFKINTETFIRQIKLDEATGDVVLENEFEIAETPDTVYGNLTIYKTAEDSKRSNNTAKDVWFNVKSDDGVTDVNVVTTAKGIDGNATLEHLAVYKPNGENIKYTITELGYKNADGTFTIPDRYITLSARIVTLKENATVTYYFANRLQKTGLIVQKQSEDGIISGFYFSVKSDDGNTDKVIITGEDGTAELTNLSVFNSSNEKIKYTIDELGFKNTDGTYYIPDRYHKPLSKTVTLEDGRSITVTMYNSLKRGSVELTKTDGAGNILEGIEFELYNTVTGIVKLVYSGGGVYAPADEDDADTVTKAVTDSEGGFLIENLLPGDYYFYETDSKGNMPYGKKIEFTISPETVKTLNPSITVENNKVIIPQTGGTGNNRSTYFDIGAAILALTIFVGALGIRKKKKHIGKKAQQ